MKTKMGHFPAMNPNPVLRVEKDGTVLYSNRASEPILHEWDAKIGGKLPSYIADIVQKAIFRNSPEKLEVKAGKSTYLISFHPQPEDESVNIYGFDISGQKELEEKLRSKEKQHNTLYKIGRMSLVCKNLQTFMDESVKLIANTMELEYCKILELMPDGNFLLRAGTGWKPGLVGKAMVGGEKESQAGYTLVSGTPVIVEDFAEEKRFKKPELLRAHGVVSGASVVIGSMDKPFGILGVHSTKKRKFISDDTYFLKSVSLMIAEAIERRCAEKELSQYKERLEELVGERTAELTNTNEKLSREIIGRKQVEKALQNNISFLETFIDAIPSPVFYRNLDYIYQGCNEMFARRLLGLPKEKVIGHSLYEFKDQFSEEMIKISEDYDNLLLNKGISLPHEVQIKCTDGEVRNFLIHKATYSDVGGNVIGIVGVALDITERKKAEQALLKSEQIRKKEIHHRIKNNLQVISSLLSLQADHFSDIKVKEAFQDSQARVVSMSLIHEELYKTREMRNVETFDFEAYIQKLANELFRSYIVGREDIHLKLDTESVLLGMDTGIPLGIIVNELVSNSLKHAFPRGRSGEIQIKLHRISNDRTRGDDKRPGSCDASEFLLIVSDNGIGLPENIDFRNTSSLGLQLVNILVEQIEGSIDLVRGAGTEFRIRFRETGI